MLNSRRQQRKDVALKEGNEITARNAILTPDS